MWLDFIKDANNYEMRKIGRREYIEKESVGVSTCYSSDEGYETALIDYNGVHPVERYKTKEQAISGHQKWLQKANFFINKEIQVLGWSDMEEDKIIQIKV